MTTTPVKIRLRTAYGSRADNAHVGGPDAKTACNIALLKDIQSHTGIPFDRLALGFQSHINETNFVHKADLTSTFAALADLGVEAMVTESISRSTRLATKTCAFKPRYGATTWTYDPCFSQGNRVAHFKHTP